MKNNILNIIRLILLSIIAITLIIVLYLSLTDNVKFNLNFIKNKTKVVYENTFSEEINNLDIYAISSDVKIEESESENINVKIYDYKDDKINVEVKDDTLNITNKNELRSGLIFSINTSPRIIIAVPKEKEYNLKVNSVSSDINVSTNLLNVNIITKSGDISILDCEYATINTSSGDVSMESVDSLDLKTTSGDIRINKINEVLNINTTSGDIKINKIDIKENSKIKATSGDILINKTNDIYIDTDVVSGDVFIKNNNRKADIELKIKTTSGDISVNN